MKYARTNKPYNWIPTLYFVEGLPYVMVVTLSTVLMQNMGLSDKENAFYTSLFYLPWVIKPLWGPVVDAVGTKRKWITAMQIAMGICYVCAAVSMNTGVWFACIMLIFWLTAFFSATHDIAADGFYILSLDSHEQALYVGIRSTFYRIATIFAQGGLLILTGWVFRQEIGTMYGGQWGVPWAIAIAIVAILLVLAAVYHNYSLPHSEKNEDKADSVEGIFTGFRYTAIEFFKRPQIISSLLFMLLFRFPEAQLAKIATPFMLAPVENGGLALSNEQIGVTYGTIGIIGLTLGGILGGIAVSRHGLKRWLWPMVLSISLPDAVYIYLSMSQTQSLALINLSVFIEQFGYGFGFTAYMLYLVYFSQGKNSTSVYALCTGFMALGMMLPGAIAGYVSEHLGYTGFFVWVTACCSVTCIVSYMLKIDENFGKKQII